MGNKKIILRLLISFILILLVFYFSISNVSAESYEYKLESYNLNYTGSIINSKASIIQRGRANQAFIEQRFSKNNAQINQFGNNNNSIIFQMSEKNNMRILQLANNHRIKIVQY